MSKPNIAIRPATPADLSAIQSLNQAHYDYENAQGFYLDDSFALDWTYSDAGAKFFLSHLGAVPAATTILAEANGRPIGYIIAKYAPHAYRSQNPIAELEVMFVEEQYRNQGVGGQLMTAFKAWARQAGAARLRVGAFAGNTDSQRFYRRHGFVDFELIMEQPLD
jgi:GNAT superfamily N-acetyltransferase